MNLVVAGWAVRERDEVIVRRSLLLVVAVLVLAGCSVQGRVAPSTVEPTADAPRTSAAPQDRRNGAAPPDVAELRGDIDAAVQVTNDFWAAHWAEYFTGTYTPPRVAGLYGPPYTAPTCGNVPPEPDNAFYCRTGEDFLAWDAGLMSKGAVQGDAWVYLIIAHEWGHAVQYRLSAELESRSAELQADCLAGATLYGAVADGTLQFEDGDEKEITNALSALSDDTPWTQEGDHGDTFERIGAFDRGRAGGVPACLPQA
jgi:uncharacterized protein